MYKYIFSKKLAIYLLAKGFCQVDMIKEDNQTIYVFISSPELRHAIKNYIN